MSIYLEMISIALQAEYFGFGISLDPAQLDPVDKGPVESAIGRVLTDPSFKVWPRNLSCYCSYCQALTLAMAECMKV